MTSFDVVDRLMPFLLGGLVFALLFVVGRRLWLWYFRIDAAILLLRKIEENTRAR
ncbi:MAG: hypothetical protein M3167_06225 [Acidobacteriota bacterium]|nr:hypothetical protein [Acidobacteriota bacterium]MDQ6892261.1 hypothetical protein [Acidobacteriota bacterium]